ncbi:MAG: hypothetical protein IT569_07720 [Leptospiraceae bacterium]|nr:hypothetical protein [Leptospiraceae bacterium]
MNIENRVKLFLSDSAKIEKVVGNVVDFVFQSELENLLPQKIELDVKTIGLLANENSFLDKKIDSIQLEKLIPVNSIGELINEETLQSLCELASVPGYEPSKEFLVKILNQKPIVELLAGIIESAIIEFNKKINPFFGAIQATGLDKQIKMFVYPFLPGLLSKIADFIFNSPKGEEGRELIRNSVRVFLTAEFSEFKSPTPSELNELKSNFLALKESVSKDTKLSESLQNIYVALRSHLVHEVQSKTLLDFLGMSPEDYSLFKTNTSKLFANNIVNFKNRESLERIVTLVVSEIVN